MTESVSIWRLMAVVLIIVGVGFGALVLAVESFHADQEANCDAAYGEEADWLGTVYHDGEPVRVCELPDGDIRLATSDGRPVR